MSAAEDMLALHLHGCKLPPPVREHRFHAIRKWRLDFAWVEYKFAVEVQGGLYVNGGHSRGEGYEKDLEKYQFAMLDGWTVYCCSPRMIQSGDAVKTIETMLAMLGAK